MSESSKILISNNGDSNGIQRKHMDSQNAEILSANRLNFRYKFSKPEILFIEEHCSPKCVKHVDSIVEEVMVIPALNLKRRESGFLDTPPAVVTISGCAGTLSPELRRLKFLGFLRESGFIRALSKFVVALSELEKYPSSEEVIPIILNAFGYGGTTEVDVDDMNSKYEYLHETILTLDAELDTLCRTLDDEESTTTEIEVVDPENLAPLQILEEEGENQSIVETPVPIIG